MAKIKRYETKTNNIWYETEITDTQLTELDTPTSVGKLPSSW